ncbi:laminin subunit beta-1-like [Saccoglossus kowalevskii]|uniref:Laminin subunit beta-4-like n=1 Tax=Saccoglossus kowalevskii TaxID=10224 RepID=A0ABM0MLH8_SACKO|nr:PREDICTED: laminin subunit beta-4-like [Saccoglossus kowalevskii]
MNHLWTALIILTAAIATVAQDTGECNNKACYPSFEDLIVTAFINRTVSVSSTCGDPANDYELIYINTQGEEMLIQETCNASIPEESHPKDYLYDSLKEVQLGVEVDVPNLDTWWQSTNNADNTQLILSLGDEFLFQSMTIAFRSPRPQDMCIETSIDYGITYKKLQYYAQDCASSFPDIPLTDINNPVRVLEATCIEAYYQGDSSTTVPGTIQQVLYNPASLFGSSFFAYESQTYFLATDIRVTLITAPGSGDPLRSFFAVVDWDVTGQCACFGHAEECMGENGADCICQHNTEGKNCESCLPLYNNREWQAGFGSSANECEECGCNGHATSCHYDETKGTGVCDDCTDNTTGDKCELCLPSYFINPYTIPGVNETCDESLVSYPCDQSCLSCNCSVEGTKMNTDCDGISGQCECKTNVEGRACDVCKDTYWNLQPSNPNGCQECTCHAPGSKDTSKFCDKETGQCICKANTEGALCDKCKDGAFSLQASNPDGCTLCNCDIGGAVASLCDKDSGVCGCRGSHIIGRSCNETEAGYYVPKLDGLLYEAELASSDQPIVIEEQPGHGEGDVTGIGYLVVSEGGTVTFSNVVVPRNQQYEVVLRYQSESLWNSFSLTLTMNSPEPYSCGDIDVPGDPIALVAGTDLPAASPSGK